MTEPPAASPPGPSSRRRGPGARDMLVSILMLLPLIGLVALGSPGCSFTPAGPTVDESAAPQVDARAALIAAARRLPFEVRSPSLPPSWRANSTDQRPVPGGTGAVRVGWITEGGRYLRLVQTGVVGDEGPLLAAETEGPPNALGVQLVGSTRWVRYAGGRDEQAWVHAAAGVRWLITGNGTEQDFQALAAAVAAAPALARSG